MIKFNEMGLTGSIQKAIDELGFQESTPIQEVAIPKILNTQKDIIALAQTGTGKTAAYGLPVIQNVDVNNGRVQGLILSPTRELCIQISNDLQSFSKYTEGLNIIPVYGGAPIDRQIRALKKGAHLVVGTPGRVNDMIRRGNLKIQNIRWLVLDEADEMLQMGFKEELDSILGNTPSNKQTLLFSATMPDEVYRIAKLYMNNPEEVSAGKVNTGADNVDHIFYVAHARKRYEVLKRISDMHPDIYGIVFCRTRRETQEVADKFMSDGYDADALHGDLSQAQRDYVMNRFRKRQIRMLVATDVAARGLDVNDLSHVINYNLPDEHEAYIHRSGRTGRAGKKGISISIINTKETGRIKKLEKLVNKKFTRALIPEGKEICKKQLFNMISKMEKVEVQDEQISEFLPEILGKLEWMSKEDLIRNFVSVEFNRFLDYYKNAPDLNVDMADSGKKSIERRKGNDRKNTPVEYSRFYMNMGSKNDLNPTKLIGLLLDATNDRSIEIGKIDIMKGFSFFEIEKSQEQLIVESFSKNIRRNKQLVKVELSNDKKDDRKNNSFDSYDNRKKMQGNRKKRKKVVKY